MTLRCADLFAGVGGFSLGAEQAGAKVVWAANHWKWAVDVHAMNLPNTQHSCQDLQQANFHAIPKVHVVLSSPACQGHSQASQPKRRRFHDALRSTAWAVVSCADAVEPGFIVIENVLDFRRWRLYSAWCDALRTLGYALEEHVLTASHHGVPQRRKRLFIVASRSKAPMGLTFEKTAEPGIEGVLELSHRVKWTRIEDASANVRKRIDKGRRNHGPIFLTQHVTGHPGVPLDEPIRTVTTKDQWALVWGDRYRPLTVRENARAMGFPDSYQLPEGACRRDLIKGLGNAVCPPVARDIITKIQAAA